MNFVDRVDQRRLTHTHTVYIILGVDRVGRLSQLSSSLKKCRLRFSILGNYESCETETNRATMSGSDCLFSMLNLDF